MQNKGILEIFLCLYWVLNASGGSHGFGQNQRAGKCWDMEAVNSYISLVFWGSAPYLNFSTGPSRSGLVNTWAGYNFKGPLYLLLEFKHLYSDHRNFRTFGEEC